MIHARYALLPSGWADNVRLDVDDGLIATLATDTTPHEGDTSVDTLLPAPGNLHSHSFQRAMAGMTEHRVNGRDSFWSWRDLMYRFAARLTPDQIEAIAALVFVEMQEAGYAAVGEFHYLHHQPDGQGYDDRAELSQRIFAAAAETGIGLTHLPVLYSHGGVRQAPLSAAQARFGNDLDGYLRLHDAARSAMRDLPADARLGIAPHSLRATAPHDLVALLAAHTTGPVHIHVAEQPREVAEVLDWLGQRPVEWLLDTLGVDARWCLVHATHMSDDETRRLAASGAVAGLCPITEANLGDGPFNGATYLKAEGRFGIGSDSNLRIALGEELRTLEYSQRSRDLARNVLAQEGSVGEILYTQAARGAAQALDRHAGAIAPGHLADLVAIDSSVPALCTLDRSQILDGLVFAAGAEPMTDLWSAGRHTVRAGRHIARQRVERRYRQAMKQLLASL